MRQVWNALLDPLVELLLHPPLQGQGEEKDLDEVEGCDEDIFIRRTNELHSLLGEQREELVVRIVVDVLVGRVVQGDEDVKEDDLSSVITNIVTVSGNCLNVP